MNKFTLIALLAAALAQEKCATTDELNNADGKTDYYLRYLSESDFEKAKEKAFTTDEPETGKYIGYQEKTGDIENLKIGVKTKFTVHKTFSEIEFVVRSKQKNTERVLQWNPLYGYHMYNIPFTRDIITTEHVVNSETQGCRKCLQMGENCYRSGRDDCISPGAEVECVAAAGEFCGNLYKVEEKFIRLMYDDRANALMNERYDIGVDETNKAGTVLYLDNAYDGTTEYKKFCFQKVGNEKNFAPSDKHSNELTPDVPLNGDTHTNELAPVVPRNRKTCKVGEDFVAALEKLNAELKQDKCKLGSVIKVGETCEVSCKAPGKGERVKCACGEDGNMAPEVKGITCTSSVAQFGVLCALICLYALN